MAQKTDKQCLWFPQMVGSVHHDTGMEEEGCLKEAILSVHLSLLDFFSFFFH